MSDMWVAVTAEYAGSTFSHRASTDAVTAKDRALQPFNRLLDEAAGCVRNGLAGWLGPQTPTAGSGWSEHEKLRAIEKIVAQPMGSRSDQIVAIKEVLDR